MSAILGILIAILAIMWIGFKILEFTLAPLAWIVGLFLFGFMIGLGAILTGCNYKCTIYKECQMPSYKGEEQK